MVKVTLIIRAIGAVYIAVWATAYNLEYNCPHLICIYRYMQVWNLIDPRSFASHESPTSEIYPFVLKSANIWKFRSESEVYKIRKIRFGWTWKFIVENITGANKFNLQFRILNIERGCISMAHCHVSTKKTDSNMVSFGVEFGVEFGLKSRLGFYKVWLKMIDAACVIDFFYWNKWYVPYWIEYCSNNLY